MKLLVTEDRIVQPYNSWIAENLLGRIILTSSIHMLKDFWGRVWGVGVRLSKVTIGILQLERCLDTEQATLSLSPAELNLT